ncbi:MAG: alkaline phosphatase family protein [Candidatus Hydrogenedentota bacterium]|nr:MAG: alkaline phosphatase family protein [Candidatus Hydrogenedentota bacterium]
MAAFWRKKKKRVCVVGLDGVPYTLAKRFTEDGTMPALADIVRTGHLNRMRVTLPEISAVSWPSFMTGKNPGWHSIFGFTDLKPDSYSIRFPSFGDLRAPTIWDTLAERKKRSVVINQPSTYPARPIEGVLISGFVALSLRKAVHPPSVVPKLEQDGYIIDIDTVRARDDHSYLISELGRTIDARERAASFFWDNEAWDFFEVVITGTDRLHHYLWDALDDPTHPCHEAFLSYYRRVDSFVAGIHSRFRRLTDAGEPTPGLFILSDHGFTGVRNEFYLNSWLKKEGFLQLEKDDADTIEAIADGSRVFALDPSRLYLNLAGKFPKGCVKPEDVRPIVADVKAGLSELTLEGERVIEKVFERDEAYDGPYAALGPDLVAVSKYGFDIKGSPKRKELFGRSALTGMHTWDDAFLWSAHEPPENLNITDVAEIILRYMES